MMSSTSSSSSSSSQKKKKPPRNVQEGNTNFTVTNNSSSTTPTLQSNAPNSSYLDSHLNAASFPATNSTTNQSTSDHTISASQDVCKMHQGKNEDTPEKATNNNDNRSSKKKQASTQASSTKPPCSSLSTSLAPANFNLKIGSPNLSSSTSPSSNSTKSTSNSSPSSTASSSPSPAQLSPNIVRGAPQKAESPLVTNSKSGNNGHNKTPLQDPLSTTEVGKNNNFQSRINLDNPKTDSLKMAVSSLLSTSNTSVPKHSSSSIIDNSKSSSAIPQITTTVGGKTDLLITKIPTSLVTNTSSGVMADATMAPGNAIMSTAGVNAQPTIPPLIIPVPQSLALNPEIPLTKTSKATPRKESAKAPRKKAKTETNETPKPVEPKTPTKNSRAKKATEKVETTISTKTTTESKRGKGKAPAKAIETTTAPVATSSDLKKPATVAPAKRKSRSASNDSSSTSAATTAAAPATPSPKRQRKKKTDPPPNQTITAVSSQAPQIPMPAYTNQPSQMTNLSTANVGPLMINTPMVNNNLGNRLMQGVSSIDGVHSDLGNRYFSPMISPYANLDHVNPSLSRSSLSRLFTSSSAYNSQTGQPNDLVKAFEELRENLNSNLYKCILDQAQQFDIPSLIGTLYTLRSENDKLVGKVRDLSMKRDQLAAMSARLDLPGPMLTQHLSTTSPNFSSVVSGLTNSPKSLPTSSPGSGISKQSLVSVGPFNHVSTGPLGPPPYLDRSSPLVSQTHSGVSTIRSSAISTPSPPISAMMAHSNSNRSGLITVNPPYNVFAPMNSLAQLGTNPPGSSYYPRQ